MSKTITSCPRGKVKTENIESRVFRHGLAQIVGFPSFDRSVPYVEIYSPRLLLLVLDMFHGVNPSFGGLHWMLLVISKSELQGAEIHLRFDSPSWCLSSWQGTETDCMLHWKRKIFIVHWWHLPWIIIVWTQSQSFLGCSRSFNQQSL